MSEVLEDSRTSQIKVFYSVFGFDDISWERTWGFRGGTTRTYTMRPDKVQATKMGDGDWNFTIVGNQILKDGSRGNIVKKISKWGSDGWNTPEAQAIVEAVRKVLLSAGT